MSQWEASPKRFLIRSSEEMLTRKHRKKHIEQKQEEYKLNVMPKDSMIIIIYKCGSGHFFQVLPHHLLAEKTLSSFLFSRRGNNVITSKRLVSAIHLLLRWSDFWGRDLITLWASQSSNSVNMSFKDNEFYWINRMDWRDTN